MFSKIGDLRMLIFRLSPVNLFRSHFEHWKILVLWMRRPTPDAVIWDIGGDFLGSGQRIGPILAFKAWLRLLPCFKSGETSRGPCNINGAREMELRVNFDL